MRFPLYPLRAYERVFEEDGYLCLETHRNRFVLDYQDKEGDYVKRRLQLLGDKTKPYELYPIYYTVENYGHLLENRNKFKNFYTGDRIVRWNKTRKYHLVNHVVQEHWEDINGFTRVKLRGIDHVFLAPRYDGEAYAQVAMIQGIRYIYQFIDDMSKGNKWFKL